LALARVGRKSPHLQAIYRKKDQTDTSLAFFVWCWGLLNDALKPA
jgi:hypothetical protein